MFDTTTIISEPSTKPSSGDTKMKITVFQMPPAISAPAPLLAMTAPTMPPISACDELLGMPYHQVMTFQVIAPTSAPNTTCVFTTPGSTMPLPTVAATLRWNTAIATRLKKAANTTACVGLSTPVETTVAIELAASWKPFMKSNSSAMTTSRITTQRAAWVTSMRSSGILEDDAFDDVGDVLALVGDRLQQFVDRLQLDHLAHVRLLAEQLAHGGAHHAVGVGFELVDLLARLQRGDGGVVVRQLAQQAHCLLHAFAAAHAQVGQASDLLGHVPHVVQRHGLGRILDQVGHVVHGVDQRVDLLAVDGRDEGRVDQAVDLVGHLVGGALGAVDFTRVLLAQVGVAVVRHQLGE